jgi:hypothetical protein
MHSKAGMVLLDSTAPKPSMQSVQDHMATLSTNSLHRHANATHASLVSDEADAAAASQVIHDVGASVRTSQPLCT